MVAKFIYNISHGQYYTRFIVWKSSNTPQLCRCKVCITFWWLYKKSCFSSLYIYDTVQWTVVLVSRNSISSFSTTTTVGGLTICSAGSSRRWRATQVTGASTGLSHVRSVIAVVAEAWPGPVGAMCAIIGTPRCDNNNKKSSALIVCLMWSDMSYIREHRLTTEYNRFSAQWSSFEKHPTISAKKNV